jgi:hypothetical protein
MVEKADFSRVLIHDQRRSGGFLRATWHPERKMLVISHWRNDICIASTAVGISDIPKLVSLLVAALADAATRQDGQPPLPHRSTAGQVPSRMGNAWVGVRRVLRRVLHLEAANHDFAVR